MIDTPSNRAAVSAEAELASLSLASGAEAIRRGDFTSETYTEALLERVRRRRDLNAGISLPAGRSRGGLPIGVEIDAPRQGDRALLALARRMESVWAGQLS